MRNNMEYLFKPESVTLAGIPRGFKIGKLFLLALLDQGYSGKIYPVNPHATEIDGIPAFARISDIPGSLDMVIVMVPREQVLGVLEECGRKGARSVILYTSGFGETGEEKGRKEQEQMREIARKTGFRILGPNCMGVYSPEGGLAFFPDMPRTPGKIGFVSQSGSLANLFVKACAPRELFFRHVVSYGNGCDLDLTELLGGMGQDEDIEILCAYCEGVQDGRSLARTLEGLAGRKPVLMWKVGRTEAGRRAAASHTGSIASGEEALWNAVFHQYGVLDVYDFEEMMDILSALYHLPHEGEGRTIIVSGPGGPAVSAADAAARDGLPLAVMEEKTREKIRRLLPATGTSAGNPVDVGLSASFEIRLYLETLEILAEDRNVDAIVVLGGGATEEAQQAFTDGLIRIRQGAGKAVLAVALPGFVDMAEMAGTLCRAGIPVYPTPERALKAYARMREYLEFSKRRRGGTESP